MKHLGADVVKVENPRSGDGNREVAAAPTIAGEGIYHLALNSGTRSLAAHPRSSGWTSLVEAAAAWADVVIVGGRRSDAERLGLGYDRMHAINPSLVYCDISGYGNDGPWADHPAHGLNPDAMSGLIPPFDQEDSEMPGWIPAGTTMAGVHAALGIMNALYQRTLTNVGQRVSVSLWRSAMWWNWRAATSVANLGEPWDLDLGGSRYTSYRTSDGGHLIVAPIEEKFWTAFVDAIALPIQVHGPSDWSGRYEFGTGPAFDGERRAIQERLATASRDHWTNLFEARGIPCSAVLTTKEAVESDHARVTGLMQTVSAAGGEADVLGSPFHAPDSPGRLDTPPTIGAHTQEILDAFGLDLDPNSLVKPVAPPATKEKTHA